MKEESKLHFPLYSVGVEDLEDYCWRNFLPESLVPDWVLYAYELDGYEGCGYAIVKEGDRYGYSSLGHCSCNGPTDNKIDWTDLRGVREWLGIDPHTDEPRNSYEFDRHLFRSLRTKFEELVSNGS